MFNKAVVWTVVVALCCLAGAASSQPGRIKRTILQTVDFPTGYQTITGLAELAPGAIAERHSHPGIEVVYVLEGEALVLIDGKAELRMKAGDSLQIAPGEVHEIRNASDKPAKAISSWVVQKGMPFAAPGPAR